jgi:hypothetical protein
MRCRCRGAGGRHRHAEKGVGAETALRRRAVEGDQAFVEGALLERGAPERLRDLAVDVRHRSPYAFPEIARLVAVPELERLAFAGGCTGGHRRASPRAAAQFDIDFNSGIAAGIEDFPRVHARNLHWRNWRNSELVISD